MKYEINTSKPGNQQSQMIISSWYLRPNDQSIQLLAVTGAIDFNRWLFTTVRQLYLTKRATPPGSDFRLSDASTLCIARHRTLTSLREAGIVLASSLGNRAGAI